MEAQPALPVAISCFIIDDDDRFLLFSRDGQVWRVMGGQLEAGETIPQCIAREIREEMGEIRYRFIDVLDAHVFAYPALGNILSVFCLLRYEGGSIEPDSDMADYRFEWMGVDRMRSVNLDCPFQAELVEKAIDTARRFRNDQNLGFWKFRWNNPS